MKLVCQRVTRASVTVEGEVVGQIERGVLVLLGAMNGDSERETLKLADKLAHFRMFEDERGRMGESLLDKGYSALVVSQFTLAADGRKGRRPSFDRALAPEAAEPLIERFVQRLSELGVNCATGRFGASMQVELVNDGPVTFVLEEADSSQVPT